MRQTRAEETVLSVKSKDWKGKMVVTKKEKGTLETDRMDLHLIWDEPGD